MGDMEVFGVSGNYEHDSGVEVLYGEIVTDGDTFYGHMNDTNPGNVSESSNQALLNTAVEGAFHHNMDRDSRIYLVGRAMNPLLTHNPAAEKQWECLLEGDSPRIGGKYSGVLIKEDEQRQEPIVDDCSVDDILTPDAAPEDESVELNIEIVLSRHSNQEERFDSMPLNPIRLAHDLGVDDEERVRQ